MNSVTEKIHRPHLTKEQRLPSCYKEVAKILEKVKNCEGNAKTIIHNSKIPRNLFRKVYGLTFNVLKQSRMLESVLKKTQLLELEPGMKKGLSLILIHEILFGKGLPGDSKPIQIIRKHQAIIEKAYHDLKRDSSLEDGFHLIPKYVRVNTLVTSLQEVIEDLEYLGVLQVTYDENISEKDYFELLKNMEKNTFLIDYHFKDVLVFHGEENLTSWSLYRKGNVFIQDKSSYIPAHVLKPEPGIAVIDACAAPGMKTLHLAAIMRNEGTIYAFERDNRRFGTLKNMLESGQVNICQASCEDFNSVDPKDEKFASVEYILLDPSCSGSGMVSRMDSVTDTEDSKNDARIEKLAGFQIVLLKHALLFPSVKRVVYSTCSITEAENEYVVHEVLAHFNHRFKLVPVLPEWSIRGSDKFEFGPLCLRAFPDKCLTNGFFVAMFERIEVSNDVDHFPRGKKDRKNKKKRGEFSGEDLQLKTKHEETDFNSIEISKQDSNFCNDNRTYTDDNKQSTDSFEKRDSSTPIERIKSYKRRKKENEFKHMNDEEKSLELDGKNHFLPQEPPETTVGHESEHYEKKLHKKKRNDCEFPINHFQKKHKHDNLKSFENLAENNEVPDETHKKIISIKDSIPNKKQIKDNFNEECSLFPIENKKSHKKHKKNDFDEECSINPNESKKSHKKHKKEKISKNVFEVDDRDDRLKINQEKCDSTIDCGEITAAQEIRDNRKMETLSGDDPEGGLQTEENYIRKKHKKKKSKSKDNYTSISDEAIKKSEVKNVIEEGNDLLMRNWYNPDYCDQNQNTNYESISDIQSTEVSSDTKRKHKKSKRHSEID